MLFAVFFNRKPASVKGFPKLTSPNWKTYKFRRFEDAARYALNWMGSYASGMTVEHARERMLDKQYYFSGENLLEIRTIKSHKNVAVKSCTRAKPKVIEPVYNAASLPLRFTRITVSTHVYACPKCKSIRTKPVHLSGIQGRSLRRCHDCGYTDAPEYQVS